jgi:hypothetical protein
MFDAPPVVDVDEHVVPLLQAVDDAEAGQEEQRPRQAELRGAEAGRSEPDGQAHAEEGQAIEKVDDDDVAGEELGHLEVIAT